VSTPRNPPGGETATAGTELVKYEPYLELVSRLWLASAARQSLADRIARTTRLNRTQGVFVDEPVTRATLPQRLAERRRDYAEYFGTLPPEESATSRRGLLQRATPEMEAAVAESAVRLFRLRPRPGSSPITECDNDIQTPTGELR
jgi:hypothetical protein